MREGRVQSRFGKGVFLFRRIDTVRFAGIGVCSYCLEGSGQVLYCTFQKVPDAEVMKGTLHFLVEKWLTFYLL
jgi:hypothetical protein